LKLSRGNKYQQGKGQQAENRPARYWVCGRDTQHNKHKLKLSNRLKVRHLPIGVKRKL
jgi:hypothetical protein